jgi:hypothetical protein
VAARNAVSIDKKLALDRLIRDSTLESGSRAHREKSSHHGFSFIDSDFFLEDHFASQTAAVPFSAGVIYHHHHHLFLTHIILCSARQEKTPRTRALHVSFLQTQIAPTVIVNSYNFLTPT